MSIVLCSVIYKRVITINMFNWKKMATKTVVNSVNLDNSDSKSDMSSVSKCSNFSIKSQQYKTVLELLVLTLIFTNVNM